MPTPAPPLPSPALRELLSDRPVFDAHADAIWRALDLGHDLGRRGAGHLDLVRGREGGLGAWVVVCWVDPELHLERAFERAADLLREAHALAERHPGLFRVVGNGAELAAARSAGCVAGVPGIEGGHALEESLEKLSWFFEHGLRVLTLVWNNHLSWIRSCQEGAGAGVPEGLSDFGRAVVREMNSLGMLVDVSHAGERSFRDVLETSTRPVMASHSGCRALHDYPRNLTDVELRALADADGVVGIVFHPGFLDAGARAEEARVRETAEYAPRPGESPAACFVRRQELMRRLALPLPAERLVDHVVHAVEVAGVDHVGIGSDYDGIARGPEWLEDATGYPILGELLLRRGFDIGDVRKILGGNMERVFSHATGPGTAAYGVAPSDTESLPCRGSAAR